MNEVYYRILLRDGGFRVVCMQWFDEDDYNHQDYFNEIKYRSEEDAWAVRNAAIIQAIRILKVEGII